MYRFIMCIFLILLLFGCKDKPVETEIFIIDVKVTGGGFANPTQLVIKTEKSGVIILPFGRVKGVNIPLGKATIIKHNYLIKHVNSIEIIPGWKIRK